MQKYTNNFTDAAGNAIAGATVTVTTFPDGLVATLFQSSAGGGVKGNPLTTDNLGYFDFYAANGDYIIQITSPFTQPVTLADVQLYDPDDGIESFTQAGAGAVPRPIQAKLRESISVMDFGAVGGGVIDDSAAFQAAVDSLPSAGGKIAVSGGVFLVNTAPILGSKSVYWDFGPDVVIQGTQTTFPKMATNGDCTVNGPYIRAQRANATIDGAASFAMAIESIQRASDTNNGYGALYVGAQTNATGTYSINSAINAVATANLGSSGNVFGIEIDVATFAAPGTGTQFGLLISGFGGNDCTFGIRINRHDGGTSKYLYGAAIAHARIGLFIDDKNASLENGLVLGDAPVRYPNQMVQALQISNGGGVLLLQRRTNTSPTGNFLAGINADNTQQLFAVDVLGNSSWNTVTAQQVTAAGTAVAVPAGRLGLGSATSASATAGAATLPASPVAFLNAYLGGTPIKIPYYAA